VSVCILGLLAWLPEELPPISDESGAEDEPPAAAVGLGPMKACRAGAVSLGLLKDRTAAPSLRE